MFDIIKVAFPRHKSSNIMKKVYGAALCSNSKSKAVAFIEIVVNNVS